MTLRIAHLSDFHHDGSPELRTTLRALVEAAVDRRPDLVIVTGDLSAGGRPVELAEVAEELARFGETPRVILPGNRDLVPSVGPPGEARAIPSDSDLDYFLALEPALSFGFAESDEPGPSPEDAFRARFGTLTPGYSDPRVHVVTANSTPRLRSEGLERAARHLRRGPDGALRVFAIHHGLLPVPGRKLRDGDLSQRAGNVLALLLDLHVDLALHGHLHRAHVWEIASGPRRVVVAGAGALVNDGRRDASYLEIEVTDQTIEIWRRTAAAGRPSLLHRGDRGAWSR